MRLPVKIHQPFGPYILETTCPKELIDALNKKIEDVCSDPEEMEKYCSSKKNVLKKRPNSFHVIAQNQIARISILKKLP